METDNRIHRMMGYLIEQMEKRRVSPDRSEPHFPRDFKYEELRYYVNSKWMFEIKKWRIKRKPVEIYVVRSLIRQLWKDISAEGLVGEFKIVIGDEELAKLRDAYFTGVYVERDLLLIFVSLSVVFGAIISACQLGLTYYSDRKSETIEKQEILLQKQYKDLQLLQQNTTTIKAFVKRLEKSNDSLRMLLPKKHK